MGNAQNCELSFVKTPRNIKEIQKLLMELVKQHNNLVREVESLQQEIRYLR